MLHWVTWILARVIYRLRVVGRENLPASGPVLLISNHVSYVDWLAIMAASPRPVRFVIASTFLHKPLIGWILRWVRVIPLTRKGGPKSLKQSLEIARQALESGEVVCIFPEAYPTRTGVMLPFHRGFEVLAEETSAPIIPICLDQLWGSVFSYKGGRLFWKWPRFRSYPVTVAFGRRQPNDISAPKLRQEIVAMSAELARERSKSIQPLHRQFVRSAARHPFRPCLIDTSREVPRPLNRATVLAGAVCLSALAEGDIGSRQNGRRLAAAKLGRGRHERCPFIASQNRRESQLHRRPRKRPLRSSPMRRATCVDLQAIHSPSPARSRSGRAVIQLEDAREAITKARQIRAFVGTMLVPGWLLDRWLGLSDHRPDDLATVIFSSGSTGEPKGVMLTHSNVAANIEAFMDYVDFTHRDRVLGILPFFHSFGYTVTLWGALLAQARTVFHPDPRAAKEIGELCRKYGCTLMAATATFLRLYFRRCQPDDFKTMRLLVCGARKIAAGID